MLPCLTEQFGNAASRTHAFGWAAAKLAEGARELLAAGIGAHSEEIIFTSGATGPAKGVLYDQRRMSAQFEAVRACYGIGPDDRLVAAFAPFALYGPALGIPVAVPDCDITKPASLRADALADACAAVDATIHRRVSAPSKGRPASGSGARRTAATASPDRATAAGVPCRHAGRFARCRRTSTGARTGTLSSSSSA